VVKVGAFTLVSHLGGAGEKYTSLDDFAGLSQRHPAAAAAMSLYLLSLLGLPVTAGFFGKFYIFKAAVNSNLIWLAILMAINSVIGSYYYLRVIVVMYMREPSGEEAPAGTMRFPAAVTAVVVITALATLYFGIAPNQILRFILQPDLLGNLR
jgi:NADH-quinone oxidoreductase subunit N